MCVTRATKEQHDMRQGRKTRRHLSVRLSVYLSILSDLGIGPRCLSIYLSLFILLGISVR